MLTVTAVRRSWRLFGISVVMLSAASLWPDTASANTQNAGGEVKCHAMGNAGVCDVDVHSGAAAPYLAPSNKAASAPKRATADEQQLQNFLASCRSTYVPPGALPLPTESRKGSWYYTPCAGILGKPTSEIGPLAFIPDSGVVTAKPAFALALRARQELVLPVPSVASSPGPDADTPKVVNVPTWAWIGKAEWAPVTATASAPNVSVTAMASPRYVVWSWGDGSSSECRGPGAAYLRGVSDPAAASPDCGHTYTQTSKSGPGLRFAVTATIHWRITWRASTGQSGAFQDMTSRTAQAWPVEEIDALNISGNQAS